MISWLCPLFILFDIELKQIAVVVLLLGEDSAMCSLSLWYLTWSKNLDGCLSFLRHRPSASALLFLSSHWVVTIQLLQEEFRYIENAVFWSIDRKFIHRKNVKGADLGNRLSVWHIPTYKHLLSVPDEPDQTLKGTSINSSATLFCSQY